MLRIKICGITKKIDAECAIQNGASALGFIFYRNSPRYIPPVKASKITQELPPFISRVGVFVDMEIQGIINIIRRVGLSEVQLHGSETAKSCYDLRSITSIPIIKAFRIKDEKSIDKIESYLYACNALLLDTYQENEVGGTGKVFNWDIAQKAKKFNKPIILAGGLNQDNIIKAYKHVRPYAFDINSGVETSPGIKDHNKIKMLFNAVSLINSDS